MTSLLCELFFTVLDSLRGPSTNTMHIRRTFLKFRTILKFIHIMKHLGRSIHLIRKKLLLWWKLNSG